MAKTKPLRGQALKEHRHKLSVLKKAGLTKIDAKRAKGTRHQKKLIKEYADVLAGKAKAVKVGTLRHAKSFPPEMKPRNGRVVVKARAGEHPHYDKKNKRITATASRYGVTYRRIILPQRVFSIDDLPKPPKGRVYKYFVPFNNVNDSPDFQDPQELFNFMNEYEKRGQYRNWMQYIEIKDIDEKDAAR